MSHQGLFSSAAPPQLSSPHTAAPVRHARPPLTTPLPPRTPAAAAMSGTSTPFQSVSMPAPHLRGYSQPPPSPSAALQSHPPAVHDASVLSTRSVASAAASRIEVRNVAELVRQLAESRYTARQLQQRVHQFEVSAVMESLNGSTIPPADKEARPAVESKVTKTQTLSNDASLQSTPPETCARQEKDASAKRQHHTSPHPQHESKNRQPPASPTCSKRRAPVQKSDSDSSVLSSASFPSSRSSSSSSSQQSTTTFLSTSSLSSVEHMSSGSAFTPSRKASPATRAAAVPASSRRRNDSKHPHWTRETSRKKKGEQRAATPRSGTKKRSSSANERVRRSQKGHLSERRRAHSSLPQTDHRHHHQHRHSSRHQTSKPASQSTKEKHQDEGDALTGTGKRNASFHHKRNASSVPPPPIRHHAHGTRDRSALAERLTLQQEAKELRRARRWQRRYYDLMSTYTEETAQREAELADIHDLIEYMTWEQDRARRLHRPHAAALRSPPAAAIGFEEPQEVQGGAQELRKRSAEEARVRRESRGTSPQRVPSAPSTPPPSRRHQAAGLSESPHREADALLSARPMKPAETQTSYTEHQNESVRRADEDKPDEQAAGTSDKAVASSWRGEQTEGGVAAQPPAAAEYAQTLRREADEWRQRCLQLLQLQPGPSSGFARGLDVSASETSQLQSVRSEQAATAVSAQVPPPLPPRPTQRQAREGERRHLPVESDGANYRTADMSGSVDAQHRQQWSLVKEEEGLHDGSRGVENRHYFASQRSSDKTGVRVDGFSDPQFCNITSTKRPLTGECAQNSEDSADEVYAEARASRSSRHPTGFFSQAHAASAQPAVAPSHRYAPEEGEALPAPRKSMPQHSRPSTNTAAAPAEFDVYARNDPGCRFDMSPIDAAPRRPPLFMGVPDYRHPETGWYSPGKWAAPPSPPQAMHSREVSPPSDTQHLHHGHVTPPRRATVADAAAARSNPLLGNNAGFGKRGSNSGERRDVGVVGAQPSRPSDASPSPSSAAWRSPDSIAAPSCYAQHNSTVQDQQQQQPTPFSRHASELLHLSTRPSSLQPSAEVVVAREQLERDIRRHDQLLAAIGKLQRTAAEHTARHSV